MSKIESILLVDDSKIDHITTKATIKKYDPSIQILVAFDGREALDLLVSLEQPVDIILLDINMPRMDGHEFLEHYSKESAPSSVVVMLTSSDQTEDKEKCRQYTFVKEYLSKPLRVETVESLEKLI